jgi:hypothetical protein
MRVWWRVAPVVLLVALAGCSTTPVTTQQITVADTVDRDCDDEVSEISARAAVSPRDPDADLVGSIGFRDRDGDRQQLQSFDVSGQTTEQVTVAYSDLNVESSVVLYLTVEEKGWFSNDPIGVDSTERIRVESAAEDQPALDPVLALGKRIPAPGESVTFSVEDSSDGGCGIDAIRWDFDGDGSVDGTGATLTHSFDREGYHEVSVTVVTTKGVESTVSETVLVTDDPGDKFRDAADPFPQSVLFPQGVLQLLLTALVVLGVRRVINRR